MSIFCDEIEKKETFLCNIVLYNPEIPQNTGNIARTCVATHSRLHLIHPMGFNITHNRIKRAGLEYWRNVSVKEHINYSHFLDLEKPKRIFYFSKKSEHSFYEQSFQREDYLVFGNESNGLPDSIISENHERILAIPQSEEVRSLNISNAVAIVVYELLRQITSKTR